MNGWHTNVDENRNSSITILMIVPDYTVISEEEPNVNVMNIIRGSEVDM